MSKQAKILAGSLSRDYIIVSALKQARDFTKTIDCSVYHSFISVNYIRPVYKCLAPQRMVIANG